MGWSFGLTFFGSVLLGIVVIAAEGSAACAVGPDTPVEKGQSFLV